MPDIFTMAADPAPGPASATVLSQREKPPPWPNGMEVTCRYPVLTICADNQSEYSWIFTHGQVSRHETVAEELFVRCGQLFVGATTSQQVAHQQTLIFGMIGRREVTTHRLSSDIHDICGIDAEEHATAEGATLYVVRVRFSDGTSSLLSVTQAGDIRQLPTA